MAKVYWLSEAEWARIERLMPRGRRGARRVDDRRIISGIVHMLRSGARWRDCPAIYGPYTTVYNRFNRWSRQGLWLEIFEALTGQSPIHGLAMIDSTHIKAHRSAGGGKRGAYLQAIGQSRGGRTSKLHALSDGQGRPLALLLTAGNINDISIARTLLQKVGPIRRPHRRSRLRRQSPQAPAGRAAGRSGHPFDDFAPQADPLRHRRLQGSQPHRANVVQAQGLAPPCHPLR